MSHLGFISAGHSEELERRKNLDYPSTTRGGKELPSSSALDSPSVMNKLATPKPATAMNADMLHIIDDATSAMHDTYDETTSLLDTTVPLGEFLDEQLARARENEILKLVILMKVMMKILLLNMNYLLCLRVMLWMKKLLETFLLAMIGVTLRNY